MDSDDFLRNALIVLLAVTLPILKGDVYVISAYALVLIYCLLHSNKDRVYRIAISSIVAVIWMLISHEMYDYNKGYFTLFGTEVFPAFAWAVGLFSSYSIYLFFKRMVKGDEFTPNFALYCILFWTLLIAAETIGYHSLNVRDVATYGNPGLPVCDCIHAPKWMQIAYLSMGPIYFALSHITLNKPNKPSKKR